MFLAGDEEAEFSTGIGKAAHEEHQSRIGDGISEVCVPVAEERLEPVEYYKVSRLKTVTESSVNDPEPPPWKMSSQTLALIGCVVIGNLPLGLTPRSAVHVCGVVGCL